MSCARSGVRPVLDLHGQPPMRRHAESLRPARIPAQCSQERESASGRWPEALNSLHRLRYPRMTTTPA
jgi:hypothetical protein